MNELREISLVNDTTVALLTKKAKDLLTMWGNKIETRRMNGEPMEIMFPNMLETVLAFKKFPDQSGSLFIMAGPHGAGKSTFVRNFQLGPVVSIDDFFISYQSGKEIYVYNENRLSEATQGCHNRCRALMENRHKIITVDNTNLTIKELEAYVTMAYSYKYVPVVILPHIYNTQSLDYFNPYHQGINTYGSMSDIPNRERLTAWCVGHSMSVMGKVIPMKTVEKQVNDLFEMYYS